MDVQNSEDYNRCAYTEFGERCAEPMRDFDKCAFYPLTGRDHSYCKMMLTPQLWKLVVSTQAWITQNPDCAIVLRDVARKDAMKAWVLTGLAQPSGTARFCCFLQMALAHEANIDCAQHLIPGSPK